MSSKTILIFFLLIAASKTGYAQNDDKKPSKLSATLSAGVVYSPTYTGDDEYQTMVFPNLSVSYGDRFKASLRGIEFVLISRDGWLAGPLLTYNMGREENPDDNPLSISGKPSRDLVGLGDIDGTVELGGFVEYKSRPFSAKLKVQLGIDGGHDGVHGEASVNYQGRTTLASKPLIYSVGPALTFGSKAYNSVYFGVSDTQSANSGLSAFDAGAGINSIGIHASAILPLTKKTSLLALAKYDELTGDIGDSSIVNQRGSKQQSTAGILINYRF